MLFCCFVVAAIVLVYFSDAVLLGAVVDVIDAVLVVGGVVVFVSVVVSAGVVVVFVSVVVVSVGGVGGVGGCVNAHLHNGSFYLVATTAAVHNTVGNQTSHVSIVVTKWF